MKTQKPFGAASVLVCLAAMLCTLPAPAWAKEVEKEKLPGGQLMMLGKDGVMSGFCPLKHTAVVADVSGYVCRVRVRQIFHNPTSRAIEAIYVFPLPQNAAVDDMTMKVGARRIRGEIKKREEARKTYEAAKAQGKTASLLDQERPNIFTQSVANIAPNERVEIEIAFTETLPLKDGFFEWVFPTVVGPRYMPGEKSGRSGEGWSPDTTQVPDASKISPPVALPGHRSGHDISLQVNLDSGASLREVTSVLHRVEVQKQGRGRATVTLAKASALPNKDFILRYRVADKSIEDAMLLHGDEKGRFFTLALQPPHRVAAKDARPKELIFVIDCSGSMMGFPIEKAKSAMAQCIKGMNPRDTFNLISFSGGLGKCFSIPVANTPTNRNKALKYLKGLHGSGGTEMLPAIVEALGRKADPSRVRIVCFMTDAYVGNDQQVIAAVRQHAGTSRVFSFGIGNSVNRYLLDGMAREGRGEVEYVTLESQGNEAARRFHERIQSPVLTDIEIDWGKLAVEDVYPAKIPDLFSAGPMMIHGKLKSVQAGVITLKGRTAAGIFERRITFDPSRAGAHEALPSLWARSKVAALSEKLYDPDRNATDENIRDEITQVALQHRLMTQYTSFVAVEDKVVNKDGAPEMVAVPVEMPDGVNFKGVFGKDAPLLAARAGDPLISIAAPLGVAQIVAILPGGEIKKLNYNPDSERWETRFDIPTWAEEGEYSVAVVIVMEDGSRRELKMLYRVDSTSPRGMGNAQLDARTRRLRLELDAGEDTHRVMAILPWGARTDLQMQNARTSVAGDVSTRRFATVVSAPRNYQGEAVVTFVLTDAAHNRTAITVDWRQ